MTNGSTDTGTEGAPRNAPSSTSHQITLKNPDAVQMSLASVWNWLEEHAKLVAAVVVIGILAGLGYLGFQALQQRQERLAQEAFYPIDAKYQKLKEGFERAKYQKLMPGMVPPDQQSKDAKAATGDLTQDFGTLISDFEKVAKDHAGTAGGAQAAILAAEAYLQYKQPDKALELAQIPANQMSSKLILANLAKVVWGNALVAKGDCQAAVGVWQQVIDNKAVSFLHSDVSLRSGLCFEQIGQAERAAEMYRKISADAPDSAAATTAKSLLRALEVKKSSAPQPAQQG